MKLVQAKVVKQFKLLTYVAMATISVQAMAQQAAKEQKEVAPPAPVVAEADLGIAPKEGVTQAELKNLVQNLEIRQMGSKLVFSGLIPERCVQGAGLQYNQGMDGKHVIVVRVAEACENDQKTDPKERRVSLSKVLGAVELADMSGSVVIRSLAKGDPTSPAREENAEKALMDSKTGQPMKIVSAADALAARKRDDQAALAKRLGELCSRGDVDGISKQAEAAAELGIDLSSTLLKAEKNRLQVVRNKIASAKNAEEMKALLEEFQENVANGKISASEEQQEEMAKHYAAKRLSLLGKSLESFKSGEMKASALDREIAGLMSELRELDGDLYKENKSKIEAVLARAAEAAHKSGDFAGATTFFRRGRDIASGANKQKWDEAMLQSQFDDASKCLKNAKTTKAMKACEASEKAAKETADRIKDSVVNSNNEEQISSYAEKYAAMFGAGPTYYQIGMGATHPYSPGGLEMAKQEVFQRQQEAQYEAYMNKMYGGQMGGMNSGFRW